MTMPSHVTLVEVSPRDGLQNEPKSLQAHTRVELVEKLVKSGLKKIEVGSFVSPKWVPQMAGTQEVLDSLNTKRIASPSKFHEVQFATLTPNLQGLESAISHQSDEVAIFGAASETFSKKNINCSIKESLNRFEAVMKRADELNIPVRGYVSTIIGCPYEGDISPDAVAHIAKAMLEMGCYEISLGDTIGVGTPLKFKAMLETVMKSVPSERLAVHCHNTYGQALANIYASLELGISVVDSAVAGLGGCPYAKGASGNIATEDVVYMLDGLGIKTGVDLPELIETSHWICQTLDRQNQSKVSLAIG